ncbi:hypothetical protein HELRODRAFT_83430 [Helobdella robusta]|uniref:F-box/LRR-repeat protein 8 n=1 Tax=Helobdella robusta TaxID=6412 RepID=T1G554_HELRO|nr:hypothetical protein HELRODRAFT_83430 [Helobdella robusta]ESN99922.1 hypothetical protein HELRODRAFT_83430 [Helobdella robusta]
MTNSELNWNDIPLDVLEIIFTNLSQGDRFRASLVSKNWCYVFNNSTDLWKNFRFSFLDEDKLENQLKGLEVVGRLIRNLHIDVQPKVAACRESAVNVINYFAQQGKRQIRVLRIRFLGNNPLLYSGNEFNRALLNYFSLPKNVEKMQSHLREVDLSKLNINIDGELLTALSKNHSNTLQKLYIHNCVLVETITPDHMKIVASRCHQLTHLGLHGYSIDDDVVSALISPADRKKLERLIIFCRRDQKYVDRISSTAWASLVAHSPNLRVCLGFDNTCPLDAVAKVMRPEIPVSELFLETYTDLIKEIRLAIKHYKNTLTKISICCPPQHDDALDVELVNLATNCTLLSSLHVFCVVSRCAIEEILRLKPILVERKSYTLEYSTKPGPWEPGNDYTLTL